MPPVRGEVYRLKSPRGTQGHEQGGRRFAVVVQADIFPLSTWVVAPTSTSARPADFRPEVTVNDVDTLVLCEQITALDPERLGEAVGMLTYGELRRIDVALRLLLDLA